MSETNSEDYRDEYQNLSFHPYNVLMILLLLGLGAIFLALSASFIYTRVQNELPPVKLPWIFIVSTAVLIGSSMTLIWAKRAYQNDETENYQKALWATMGLTILFLILQFIGWGDLFSQEVFPKTDNSAGYMYVLSILHFAHVIAGIPFLALFIYTARKRMKEPVSVFVYFSDPEKKLKLRLLTIYWHFLDGLWIYLIIFLLINAFIGTA